MSNAQLLIVIWMWYNPSLEVITQWSLLKQKLVQDQWLISSRVQEISLTKGQHYLCYILPCLDLTWWVLGRPPCGSIGPRRGCLNAGRGQLNAGGQLRAGGGRALWRCRMEPVFKNMNGVRMHYIRWQGIPVQYSPGKKGKFIWILMGSKSSVFIIMGGSCSWVCFP